MWKEIINNLFNHVWELIVLLLPTLVSLFLTWYPSDKIHLISSKIYLSIIIILVVILFVLIKFILTTIKLINEKIIVLPRLKTIKNNRLIFSPSEIFSAQSIISIYYKDDIEQFIGYGIVETIISDTKYIQVKVEVYSLNWDENRISNEKNNIILKPSVPTEILKTIGA